MGVRVWDGIAPASDFVVLANGRYVAKAWDDRVGLAVMLVAARRILEDRIRLPAQIAWVPSTQEEIGLRGAQTAVTMVAPEIGISIEAGVAADFPSHSGTAPPRSTNGRGARDLPLG